MAANNNKSKGVFTDVELEAMRARAKELKAEEKSKKNKQQGEKDVMNAIAKLTDLDKTMALRIFEIVKTAAPELFPKTWYGMPAFANKEGKVICFFQAANKFESRYATFGFSDSAKLDNGNMWPTSFALNKLTNAEENEIIKLIKKAVG